jgi:hypothetical protein
MTVKGVVPGVAQEAGLAALQPFTSALANATQADKQKFDECRGK